MLLKATGGVPHEGGQRTKPGEKYYEILRAWIADGAKLDLKAPRVTKHRSLPARPGRAADRRAAADARRRDLRRRQDARRDRARRSSRAATSTWPATDGGGLVHDAAPRRSAAARPLRRRLRRDHADRDGRSQRLRLEAAGDLEPHRRTRRREVAADEDPAVRRSAPTPSSCAASISISPACRRPRRKCAPSSPTRARRARSATRSIDKLIGSPEFVEHWTNKWADLLQVNSKFLGGEGATALPRVDPQGGRGEHALRPVRPQDPHRQRLEQGEPGGELLQDPARPGGDDGEHHAPLPRHALQLQQVPRPSVRALDAGSVLRARRVLRAGRRSRPIRRAARREDRRHRGRKGASRCSKSSTDAPTGEMMHERTGQGRRARSSPIPAQDGSPAQARRRDAARRVDDLAGQPLLRHAAT